MHPSDEQLIVIKNIDKINIMVDSVPGSGKTTTNIFIAKEYPNKNILLLTFNRKLCDETKKKLNEYNIRNMEAYTYHGFCSRKYGIECSTDKGIEKVLKSKKKLNFNYDIIILDESQDIYELFYKLICKITFLNKKDFSLCILGDKNQSIYDFKGADERYLTEAQHIYNFNDKKWLAVKLSTSYRMTIPMVKFMNDCVIQESRIVSKKTGVNPDYYVLDMFSKTNIVTQFNIIRDVLLKYNPEDVFILAPSVKSKNKKSPLTAMENYISNELKKLVYIPGSDDSELDDNEIKGKVVFSTFHQSKGLERKVVICYSMDDSYFKYNARKSPKNQCPNTIYVALSRATEKLIIFHNKGNGILPFINKQKLFDCVNLHGKIIDKEDNEELSDTNSVQQVTNLIRFLPEGIINELISTKLEKINIKKGEELKLTSLLNFNHFGKEYWENVSTINGIILPMYYEYMTTKNITSIGILKKIYMDHKINSNIIKNIKDEGEKQDVNEKKDEDENIFGSDLEFIIGIDINKEIKLDDMIKTSIYFDAYITKYTHKTKQIKNYNWITEEQLTMSNERFKSVIKPDAKYEVKVSLNNYDKNNNILKGFIDCINGREIYEFKYVKEIKDEHILQLCLYIHLFAKNNKIISNEELNKYQFYIFNVRFDEIIEIKTTLENLEFIYDKVIDIKLNGYYKRPTNDVFFLKCQEIHKEYLKCEDNFKVQMKVQMKVQVKEPKKTKKQNKKIAESNNERVEIIKELIGIDPNINNIS
jgi:hypothetical protein